MLTELKNRIARANTLIPEKGPSHAALAKLVGRWKVEGANSESAPKRAGARVHGEETYEWLDGEYFLVNRSDRNYADERVTGLGWIGYDESADAYLMHSISSSGFLRVYLVEISDGEQVEIVLSGEFERATLKLSADRRELNFHWEHREPEGPWQPLCDLVGKKA